MGKGDKGFGDNTAGDDDMTCCAAPDAVYCCAVLESDPSPDAICEKGPSASRIFVRSQSQRISTRGVGWFNFVYV